MANKGSFYYDQDYDLDSDYHNSFEYAYEDNLPGFDLSQVFSCGFMVLTQLTTQFLYLFAINLVYRVIRQTGWVRGAIISQFLCTHDTLFNYSRSLMLTHLSLLIPIHSCIAGISQAFIIIAVRLFIDFYFLLQRQLLCLPLGVHLIRMPQIYSNFRHGR